MSSFVRALYEFSGEPGSSEISIKIGEILTVTRTDVGEGWWEGKKNNGEIGLFPAAYVEVMSASEVKEQQYPPDYQNSGARYDSTADEYNNEGDDWEDDWDDENDTYSEINPPNISKEQSTSVPHSANSYDKYLPATPGDDISLVSVTTGSNTTTLKKSSMFGRSSDSFILGLGNKEKLPDNEKVKIVPFVNLYQWQPNFDPYSVTVDSPKKESKFKGMKTFIAYQLTPSFNNNSKWTEWKSEVKKKLAQNKTESRATDGGPFAKHHQTTTEEAIVRLCSISQLVEGVCGVAVGLNEDVDAACEKEVPSTSSKRPLSPVVPTSTKRYKTETTGKRLKKFLDEDDKRKKEMNDKLDELIQTEKENSSSIRRIYRAIEKGIESVANAVTDLKKEFAHVSRAILKSFQEKNELKKRQLDLELEKFEYQKNLGSDF